MGAPILSDRQPSFVDNPRSLWWQPLNDGDSVTVIKDLKVKGSSTVLKVGTKVKAYASSPRAIPTSIVVSKGSMRWR
jgi:PhnA-like protein